MGTFYAKDELNQSFCETGKGKYSYWQLQLFGFGEDVLYILGADSSQNCTLPVKKSLEKPAYKHPSHYCTFCWLFCPCYALVLECCAGTLSTLTVSVKAWESVVVRKIYASGRTLVIECLIKYLLHSLFLNLYLNPRHSFNKVIFSCGRSFCFSVVLCQVLHILCFSDIKWLSSISPVWEFTENAFHDWTRYHLCNKPTKAHKHFSSQLDFTLYTGRQCIEREEEVDMEVFG